MCCNEELLREHRALVKRQMGWDDEARTQVAFSPELSESYPLVLYRLGGDTVFCLAEGLEDGADTLLQLPENADFSDAFHALFEGLDFVPDDAEYRVLDSQAFLRAALPEGYEAIALSPDLEGAVESFLENLPIEERTLAQVRAEDPIAFGIACEGELAAVATALTEGGLADIAVAVHPYYRELGLGAACVSLVCEEAFRQKLLPQYRVELKNEASASLARKLGFQPSIAQFGGVAVYPGDVEKEAEYFGENN